MASLQPAGLELVERFFRTLAEVADGDKDAVSDTGLSDAFSASLLDWLHVVGENDERFLEFARQLVGGEFVQGWDYHTVVVEENRVRGMAYIIGARPAAMIAQKSRVFRASQTERQRRRLDNFCKVSLAPDVVTRILYISSSSSSSSSALAPSPSFAPGASTLFRPPTVLPTEQPRGAPPFSSMPPSYLPTQPIGIPPTSQYLSRLPMAEFQQQDQRGNLYLSRNGAGLHSLSIPSTQARLPYPSVSPRFSPPLLPHPPAPQHAPLTPYDGPPSVSSSHGAGFQNQSIFCSPEYAVSTSNYPCGDGMRGEYAQTTACEDSAMLAVERQRQAQRQVHQTESMMQCLSIQEAQAKEDTTEKEKEEPGQATACRTGQSDGGIDAHTTRQQPSSSSSPEVDPPAAKRTQHPKNQSRPTAKAPSSSLTASRSSSSSAQSTMATPAGASSQANASTTHDEQKDEEERMEREKEEEEMEREEEAAAKEQEEEAAEEEQQQEEAEEQEEEKNAIDEEEENKEDEKKVEEATDRTTTCRSSGSTSSKPTYTLEQLLDMGEAFFHSEHVVLGNHRDHYIPDIDLMAAFFAFIDHLFVLSIAEFNALVDRLKETSRLPGTICGKDPRVANIPWPVWRGNTNENKTYYYFGVDMTALRGRTSADKKREIGSNTKEKQRTEEQQSGGAECGMEQHEYKVSVSHQAFGESVEQEDNGRSLCSTHTQMRYILCPGWCRIKYKES